MRKLPASLNKLAYEQKSVNEYSKFPTKRFHTILRHWEKYKHYTLVQKDKPSGSASDVDAMFVSDLTCLRRTACSGVESLELAE